MVRGPLQEPRRSSHFPAWLGWQRLFTGLPDRHRALHANDIWQAQFGEAVAKLGVDAVSGVGQNHPSGHLRRHRCPNLVQRDLRLGLKLNLFRHFRLIPSRAIRGPFLRQIETIPNRQAGTPCRHRPTNGDTAVLLLTYWTAVLPRDADRMLALLRKSG